MEVVEEGEEWPAVTWPERVDRVDAMGVQQVGKT
jgi:hypothetical protein